MYIWVIQKSLHREKTGVIITVQTLQVLQSFPLCWFILRRLTTISTSTATHWLFIQPQRMLSEEAQVLRGWRGGLYLLEVRNYCTVGLTCFWCCRSKFLRMGGRLDSNVTGPVTRQWCSCTSCLSERKQGRNNSRILSQHCFGGIISICVLFKCSFL